MKTYGQFCPIARASEILAERWTPIIVRNLLLGSRTFNEIASGAPGLSRALLSKRLRDLKRAGVIEIIPKPDGRGSVYELTRMGRELWNVLTAMGDWAEKWMEVTPQHSDPDAVLWSWCHGFLRRDRLPEGRILVRFEFPGEPAYHRRFWLLLEDREGELCTKYPGFEEGVIVVVEDTHIFARWHLGLVKWGTALRAGHVRVTGQRDLPARGRPGTPARTSTPSSAGTLSREGRPPILCLSSIRWLPGRATSAAASVLATSSPPCGSPGNTSCW